ncbi:MAG: tyrosine transporter [Waddliaceae bacterium]|jgi:tyrosine-specific transport protein|nr:tyrosine transporter [Waddliaceae bacterium]MBT3578365.1 tyrosine transporter [Waddliaceae bacterium]MBT4445552.1 tyrosine transporter [Waddliaceae bacterium]MBT6929100.1 tyrosine transporter [Waddliaceae bacterium]MBT7264404.1 tyrosine transporter [Waddliaceae bacterium]
MNRLIGGILLIAGNCIGAGMLALPILTGAAGYAPSLTMFLVIWAFMTYTALLLAEVNLWYGKDVSIISMAERTLGRYGKGIAWAVYLFLFYSLTVAYVALSGEIFTGFIADITGIPVPHWAVSLFFVVLFGVIIYRGTKTVDVFNRTLMFGLVIAYAALVVFGMPHVDGKMLSHASWGVAPWIVPVIITSFGFHNIIPTLTTYLRGDVHKLRTVIIVGSIIPLFVYLIWESIILGIIPVEGLVAALREGHSTAYVVKGVVGGMYFTLAAQTLAFFAIVTSLLGVGISFVDFLADGLKIKKDRKGKVALCFMVLALPYFLAISYPAVFFTALTYAGGYGAVILFGILPAAMVWSGRKKGLSLKKPLPGGKKALIAVIAFAVTVIAFQTAQECGKSPIARITNTSSKKPDSLSHNLCPPSPSPCRIGQCSRGSENKSHATYRLSFPRICEKCVPSAKKETPVGDDEATIENT